MHCEFYLSLFDKKLTFKKHIRSTASSIAEKVEILRKCMSIYDSQSIIQNCFSSFLLPFCEYCAPVWRSAADSHLKLLNRSINMVRFILPDLKMDLRHRHHVGSLSLFFKIINNIHHHFFSKIPAHAVPQRNTRQAVNQNDRCFVMNRCLTEQFSRTFVPYSVREWNLLPNDVVTASNIDTFK